MKKLYYFLPVIAIPAVLLLMSYHTGSPGGRTGSPGDNGNTCTNCHSGTANSVTGWITTNVPPSGFVGGQTYTITATGTHTGVVLFGFELTVENAQGQKVGTLQITDPTRTQLANANHSVTHTENGITPTGNSNSWSMNWVAPSNVSGQVGIYAAFNAANGNGNNTGDVIYKSSIFISPAPPPAPALVSIVPNTGVQNQAVVVTITGSNTTWSGSPAVSLKYSLNLSEVITASSVTVTNATHLQATFNIPLSASTGLWDLYVDALSLENAFTVTLAPPAISFIDPNVAFQGELVESSIEGINTSWNGTNPAVSLVHGQNPGEVINGTNVTVVSNTQLTADFDIPSDAQTGNYTLHVDDLSQNNAFTVLLLTQSIAGISPNQAFQNQTVVSGITGVNTSFTQGQTTVVLKYHDNPSETITASIVNVISPTSLDATLDIPYEATPGLWDLYVDDLSLENAFTVIDLVPALLGIEPNTAVQGDAVVTTITAENTMFTLGTPAVSLSFSGDPLEIVPATSVNVLGDNTLEASFSIPMESSVGSWDVHVDDLVLEDSFTIEMFIGIADGELAMAKLYPNPASGSFYVENIEGAKVSILNSKGEILLSSWITSAKQKIDISTVPGGIYLVRLQNGNTVRTEKLLVH